EAARAYISSATRTGMAVRFGAPRVKTEIPRSFKAAINFLCVDCIGEGGGWPTGKVCTPRLRPQDGGLDVVAWRDWPDKLPGKMMLWGACATGGDWERKAQDLMLGSFTGEWMVLQPITPILRAF